MNSILLAIILTAAAPPSFTVQTLDGQTLVGPLVELTADRLGVDAADGRVSAWALGGLGLRRGLLPAVAFVAVARSRLAPRRACRRSRGPSSMRG